MVLTADISELADRVDLAEGENELVHRRVRDGIPSAGPSENRISRSDELMQLSANVIKAPAKINCLGSRGDRVDRSVNLWIPGEQFSCKCTERGCVWAILAVHSSEFAAD